MTAVADHTRIKKKTQKHPSATYRAVRQPLIVSYTCTYQKTTHDQLLLHVMSPKKKIHTGTNSTRRPSKHKLGNKTKIRLPVFKN